MTLVLPAAERKLLLSLLCVASFSVAFNNMIVTPILSEIAADFGVKVAVAGLMVTAYAIVASVAAVFSGPIIDRLGRRPVVLSGMAAMAIATGLSAVAPNFWLLIGSRALGGLGAACLTPAVFAAVGDYFAYEERGRAVSWVMSANTSASILGVPIGAAISSFVSWRFTFVLLSLMMLVFLALLYRKLPNERADVANASSNGLRTIPRVLKDRQTSLAMLANFVGTSYWFIPMTFIGAYFHHEFGLANWALGGVTMVMGVGILIGSNIGGRLGDRIGKRQVILWASTCAATFIGLATTAAMTLPIALVCLCLFTCSGGARFSNAQAMLTELSPSNRGTVMALNASLQQLGIVTGSLTGALILEVWGYRALGPSASVLAVVSLVIYGLFVKELPSSIPAVTTSVTDPQPELATASSA